MGWPCWIWRRWYLFAIMNNFTLPPVAISDPQYVVCDRCDNALFPLEKKHKLGRCTLRHSAFAQQIITIYPPACSGVPQWRHPFNSIQDRTLTGVQHPSQTSLLCHRSVVSQESCARESVEKQGCNSVASRWKNSIMLKLAFTGYICRAGRRWSRDSHLLPQPSLNTHPQSRTH